MSWPGWNGSSTGSIAPIRPGPSPSPTPPRHEPETPTARRHRSPEPGGRVYWRVAGSPPRHPWGWDVADDSEPGSRGPGRAARIGFGLFWVYVILYFGFIALVLFRPDILSSRPFGGVNLAIASGLGLIAAALLLSVVYMVAARVVESPRRGRR